MKVAHQGSLSLSAAHDCAWCREGIPPTKRRDSRFCSQRCRQAHWRFAQHITAAEASGQPARLAYADPPYPGLAGYYRDHPDYGGEVDHVALVSALQRYDGWALSTSSASLPEMLRICADLGLTFRLAAWVRGPRPNRSRWPLQSWEPVVYCRARRDVSSQPGADSLVFTSRPRTTDPRRVIGAKPAAFCNWMFQLIGARRGDSLDDLYPGSGGVRRAWDLFVAAGNDASSAGEPDAFPRGCHDASSGAGETRRVSR